MSENFIYSKIKQGTLDMLPSRLREKSDDNPHGYMMREAAQELDRLRAENAELKKQAHLADAIHARIADLNKENADLRAALERTARLIQI